MTTPRTVEDTSRTVYHRPSDMYVTLHSVDTKSRASITHPLHGACTVPCSELSEV